jgi:hypothetical protein
MKYVQARQMLIGEPVLRKVVNILRGNYLLGVNAGRGFIQNYNFAVLEKDSC